jgi:hypothetical protein
MGHSQNQRDREGLTRFQLFGFQSHPYDSATFATITSIVGPQYSRTPTSSLFSITLCPIDAGAAIQYKGGADLCLPPLRRSAMGWRPTLRWPVSFSGLWRYLSKGRVSNRDQGAGCVERPKHIRILWIGAGNFGHNLIDAAGPMIVTSTSGLSESSFLPAWIIFRGHGFRPGNLPNRRNISICCSAHSRISVQL